MQYQSSCAPILARKSGIEHWFPCGADGQAAGGRAVYGHVITKFSVMGRFTYPWCSAGALRAPELRYKDNDQRKARKEDFKKNAEKCFVTLFVTLFLRDLKVIIILHGVIQF